MIASSVGIQQKLFNRSCAEAEMWDLCSDTPNYLSMSMLKKRKLYVVPHTTPNSYTFIGTRIPAVLCPLAKLHLAAYPHLDGSLLYRMNTTDSDSARLRFDFKTFDKDNGSYRDMQLADPPSEKNRFESSRLAINARAATYYPTLCYETIEATGPPR